MPIIFGWGYKKTKNHGPAYKKKCDNCHNESEYTLIEISIWFTLFFIPVFPYERHYLLMCPICGNGFELNKQAFEELKAGAEQKEDKK